MRSEEGDWRRQDATEVWYFAEKSSHCLKVDGVTPRRKITSGAASINSLLPHAHSRNRPYPRSEGNSSSIILVPTLPPTSLRLSFFLTRLSTLPPSGSSVLPSLLGISLELNLFLRHSICHAILMNDEFMGLRETKRNSFAFLKNVYTHIYVYRRECYRRRLSQSKISSFCGYDTFRKRVHAVPNVPSSSFFDPTQESASWIEEVLILSIKIY